ncbi:hypothetical protein X551_04697 [Methylibium sp. T29]|nr:hypothetical protein X551_04697 [Methylibium sp. T29]
MLDRGAGGRAARLVLPGAGAVVDRVAVEPLDRQHDQRQHAGPGRGDAPRTAGRREPGHEHRADCPAEVAGDAVHREGVAQARLRHALVEDGEVDRVERRVAQPGQRRGEHQAAVAGGRGGGERRRGEQRQREEQHRPRADAVDQEAGQRLADARDHEEHRDQQAELGVAVAEVADEGREQRRQHHVEEVRGAVRKADQADGAGVLAQRAAAVGGLGRERGA